MNLEYIRQAFELVRQTGPIEILDVAIVAVVIYQFLKLFRGTRATQLLAGLVLLAVLGVVAVALNLILLKWIFVNAGPYVIFALLVLFQPELRRALDQVGRLGHLSRPLTGFSSQALSRSMLEAVRAAERLSARRTGALIAFEREVGLEDYAATGVRINGEVTAEFLQAIFFPNSPLHDGAVIIRGNLILAAGCLLPLPEEGQVRERLGTRHRAAIGLSQVSDALVLVVSEETGQISVVEDGRIARGLDGDALRRRLVGGSPGVRRRTVSARPLLGWLK